MSIKQQLKDTLSQITGIEDIEVSYPQHSQFGDYSTNAAFVIAKKEKTNPKDTAEKIISKLKEDGFIQSTFEEISFHPPGFINFYLKEEFLYSELDNIINQSSDYLRQKSKNKKVQVEFISANPTGPLTLANGRGAAIGDTLANVLSYAGYNVEKEYYINDKGNQIKILGKSILAAAGVIEDNDEYYHGDYLLDFTNYFKKENLSQYKDREEELGNIAAEYFLENLIKPPIEKIKINFDVWFSEKKNLHDKNLVEQTFEFLKSKNLIYEKDGAYWMQTTRFGDDKDRVLITKDGNPTYFLVDIAYHKNKIDRGFDKIIDIWGADHHGYVKRMMSAMDALGHKDKLHIIIMQLVKIQQGGKIVRMSKRKGIYITLEEIMEEIGPDAIRWFFLEKNPDTHITLDIDLAKQKTKQNPIYYVQYAHTRLYSILEKSKGLSMSPSHSDNNNTHEKELISMLIKSKEVIEDIAQTYHTSVITSFIYNLADKIHKFYETSPVITENKIIENRIKTVQAACTILKTLLTIIGVSAPEKM